MKIFGVRVDEVDLDGALERVYVHVHSRGVHDKPYFIVTPNPEQIVQAQEDSEFKNILNSADLAIPDGVGLRLVGVKTRVAGIELMEALMKTGKKYMMVGGKRGWPDVAEINRVKPDFLFVGLGAPKQEKWVAKNLDKLRVKVVMVVGGALDQIADPSLRPPKWLNRVGLGWLYRLLRQPWRWRRQLRLIRFGWMVVDKVLKLI